MLRPRHDLPVDLHRYTFPGKPHLGQQGLEARGLGQDSYASVYMNLYRQWCKSPDRGILYCLAVCSAMRV